jgi:hypothetical protein
LKSNVIPCAEAHLPEYAKRGNAVPASAWLEAAARHLASARAILDDDPAGAHTLAWTAMHKIAKGIAASGGLRIENETHAKMAAFLICVFDAMDDIDKGRVRFAQTARNNLSYDDPRLVDQRIVRDIVDLAERMLEAARTDEMPKARPLPKKRIPPPPSSC